MLLILSPFFCLLHISWRLLGVLSLIEFSGSRHLYLIKGLVIKAVLWNRRRQSLFFWGRPRCYPFVFLVIVQWRGQYWWSFNLVNRATTKSKFALISWPLDRWIFTAVQSYTIKNSPVASTIRLWPLLLLLLLIKLLLSHLLLLMLLDQLTQQVTRLQERLKSHWLFSRLTKRKSLDLLRGSNMRTS